MTSKERTRAGRGQWFLVELNTFNAHRAADWRFYFGDRPASGVVLACAATRALLRRGELRDALTHAQRHLLPGGLSHRASRVSRCWLPLS